MYTGLSDIQKQLFLETAGRPYPEGIMEGELETTKPYNQEGKYLWLFTFVIEPDTGYLICELIHRMTNNRIFGWDRTGNKLSREITDKYFIPHF